MLWRLKSIFNYFLRRFCQIMKLCKIPCFICSKFNDLRHKIIFHEMLPILNKSYIRSKISRDSAKNSKIIWTFWWQGYNKMPSIIEKCFSSLLKNSNGHKVILITRYNINKYVDLPFYILKKQKDGCISLTHFSDILRFSLLKKYGGLWVDSTVFCASPLSNKYFKEFYTAQVGTDKYHFSISHSKWSSFLIGGDKDLPLFIFMTNFFKYYWKKYNCVIDYFMMDYALFYAYSQNIGDIYSQINNDDNQPHMFALMELMSSKYNKEQYENLRYDTDLFKLTYKKKLDPVVNSYYYYFLNNYLK